MRGTRLARGYFKSSMVSVALGLLAPVKGDVFDDVGFSHRSHAAPTCPGCPPGLRPFGERGSFLRKGSVDGGLLLFLLSSPNRFSSSETNSSSTFRLPLSAGESPFSAAISSATRCTVSSTLMLSMVTPSPVSISCRQYTTGFKTGNFAPKLTCVAFFFFAQPPGAAPLQFAVGQKRMGCFFGIKQGTWPVGWRFENLPQNPVKNFFELLWSFAE